jgi:GTP-binding protein
MNISSAKFVRGITDPSEAFFDELPHIAFIGRSNVGKSSTINSLTKVKGLAKTSSSPGSTQQINFFLVNNKFYIVDLPGYGYARASATQRTKMTDLINAYLFSPGHVQKNVVLIVDGNIGPTKDDIEILTALESHGKNIVVAVNKIDKIKKSDYKKQMDKIRNQIGAHTIVPYSTEKKTGIGELLAVILK